jgi:lipid-binding SYLF domain-containing protein
MTRSYLVVHLAAAALFAALLPGSPAAQTKEMTPAEHRAQLRKEASETIASYKKADPSLDRFFRDSVGYVVFPRIGKAGFIIGGGHGAGETYEKGKVIGTATITIATVGLQIGAQEFSEIIFFQDRAALDRFKQNKFEFTANVSAVIVTAGAAKAANYRDGVAVFAQPRGGVMAEVALGAQKFSFKPETGSVKK